MPAAPGCGDAVEYSRARRMQLRQTPPTPSFCGNAPHKQRATRTPACRYSVYLLYWYESTNTDAEGAAGSIYAVLDLQGQHKRGEQFLTRAEIATLHMLKSELVFWYTYMPIYAYIYMPIYIYACIYIYMYTQQLYTCRQGYAGGV